MNKEIEDAIYTIHGAKMATDIDNEVLTKIIGSVDGKIIFTSNYTRCGSHEKAVSVSASVPEYFQGEHLKMLAPSWNLIMSYKEGRIDANEYEKRYIDLLETERNLDPKEVFNALPNGTILLCYEKPGEFCHRRILAKWLENATGSPINEWSSEDELKKQQVVDDLLCF